MPRYERESACRCPLWVGGQGHKEEDLDEFFKFFRKTKEQTRQTGRHGYVESLEEFNS